MPLAGPVLGRERGGHQLAALVGQARDLLLRRPQLGDVEHGPHQARGSARRGGLHVALLGHHRADAAVGSHDAVLQPGHHPTLPAGAVDGGGEALPVAGVGHLEQALRPHRPVRRRRDPEDAEHLFAPGDDARAEVERVAAEARDALGARQVGQGLGPLLLPGAPPGDVLHHRHPGRAPVDQGGGDDHRDPPAVLVAEGQVELLHADAAEPGGCGGDLVDRLLRPEGVRPGRPQQLPLAEAGQAAEAGRHAGDATVVGGGDQAVLHRVDQCRLVEVGRGARGLGHSSTPRRIAVATAAARSETPSFS
jgi:hypothetical protein